MVSVVVVVSGAPVASVIGVVSLDRDCRITWSLGIEVRIEMSRVRILLQTAVNRHPPPLPPPPRNRRIAILRKGSATLVATVIIVLKGELGCLQ